MSSGVKKKHFKFLSTHCTNFHLEQSVDGGIIWEPLAVIVIPVLRKLQQAEHVQEIKPIDEDMKQY